MIEVKVWREGLVWRYRLLEQKGGRGGTEGPGRRYPFKWIARRVAEKRITELHGTML